MPKKIPSTTPEEIPSPLKHPYPKLIPDYILKEPSLPVEDPDSIPDDDPFKTAPYEIPEPGEGP